MSSTPSLDQTCVFCSKSKDEVGRLFAMPNTAVCEDCIDSLSELLFEVRNECEPTGQFLPTGGAIPTELLGEWSRRPDASESAPVSLRFYPDGLFVSTVRENGEPKSMLMRYRIEGSNRLVSTELVKTRSENSATFRIDGEVLTIDDRTQFERPPKAT